MVTTLMIPVQLANPAPYGLLICIPTRSLKSPIQSGITLGSMKHYTPPGSRCELLPLTGDGIFRMRNLAANSVLFDPAFAWVTHILFVDDDIFYTLDDVNRLISSGCDLIAGCYPKRCDNLEYVVNLYPGDTLRLRTGPMRAACIGTGFMLISRKCLTDITQRLPRGPRTGDPRYHDQWFQMCWWYNPDDGLKRWWFDFFPMFAIPDPDSGFVRQLSEDWIFSKLALLAGIQPYIHTDVILKHVGDKIYG